MMPRPPRPRWSPEESRLVRRYGERLRADRYDDAWDAAWAFNQELERLRRRYPDAAWLNVRRSRVAVSKKIWRAAGHQEPPLSARRTQGQSRRWVRQEMRVLDSYARAVARGRYRSALEASREFEQDLKRLLRRYPGAKWLAQPRTLCAIYPVLSRRARVFGRSAYVTWSPEENRLLDRLAGRVVSGRCRSAKQAALEFLQETARLRERYPKQTPLYPVRHIRSVHTKMWIRAQELGRPLLALEWAVPELVVLDRYARRFLAGEFRHAKAAARGCTRAIEELHRARPLARSGP